MDLILKFPDIEGSMSGLVGGKAVNLGVMTRAGLPVPPGVCVTTEAYRRVTEHAGLDAVIGELRDAPRSALPALAARAREIVLRAPVPADIASAVRRAADGPVAVRSSATAEDLPHASFAGQQDTYLNVIGEEAVLDAVRKCWASLWTDRAVTYRAANDVDHGTVRLAVVIQRMVQAETAGVMFTANPVTGTRRQAVIDAAPGLGESVVSGLVNPDHFVVDPASGRILDRRLGDKTLTVRPLPGGGVEHVPTGDARACLSDERLRALAALGAKVEAVYGAPQDTEWAIDSGGVLWLTQARPITTLYPLPERRGGGVRAYFNVSVAQGVYRPFTPMGMSAFKAVSSGAARLAGFPVAEPTAGSVAFAEAGGRLFVDATAILRSSPGRTIAPRLLDVMEARSATIMRGLFDDPRFSLTRRSWLPFLRRLTRIALHHRVPIQLAQALLSPARARHRAARAADDLLVRLSPPPGASVPERADHVARMLATRSVTQIAPRMLPVPLAGFLMLALAACLLGDRARPGELQTVLRGLPHNVTTEMDLALWHLAEQIRANPETARLFLETPPADLFRVDGSRELPQELTAFLARYGDRAVAEIDLGLPRWSEDPTHVIGMIANYLRLKDPELAPDRLFAKGAAEAERTIRELGRRAGPVRGPLVRFALGRTRALAGLRELPKFAIVRVFAALRAQIAGIGADLARGGLLDAPEDVFFVTLAEAGSGADLRETVTARRETYGRELRRRHLPRILLSDGTEPEAVAPPVPEAAGEKGLSGTPASAGVATGPARVVLDPVGAHVEPGEILVCPSTDPGWTPLFLTAGGLVMEMGGANSHGAVVAREYGIPAVVGVAHATDRLTSGAQITVDGSTGTVAEAG